MGTTYVNRAGDETNLVERDEDGRNKLCEQKCWRDGDEHEAAGEELSGSWRMHLFAGVSATEGMRQQGASAGPHTSDARGALFDGLEVEHSAH